MDKRGALRFPSEIEAECRSCDRGWGTRLINISTTGCMISCPPDKLPDGALMRLRVKGLTAIDGEIVWQHRNHAGIRFKIPLHPAVLQHLARSDAQVCHDAEACLVDTGSASPPARAASAPRGESTGPNRRGLDQPESRRASAG